MESCVCFLGWLPADSAELACQPVHCRLYQLFASHLAFAHLRGQLAELVADCRHSSLRFCLSKIAILDL